MTRSGTHGGALIDAAFDLAAKRLMVTSNNEDVRRLEQAALDFAGSQAGALYGGHARDIRDALGAADPGTPDWTWEHAVSMVAGVKKIGHDLALQLNELQKQVVEQERKVLDRDRKIEQLTRLRRSDAADYDLQIKSQADAIARMAGKIQKIQSVVEDQS